ncbi:hypothetical protein O6H91_02G124500 [Diphasiastrum complanatum]|nr:hypothetical protein O6H91_02G124500 [Diphasiastrum complanatum]
MSITSTGFTKSDDSLQHTSRFLPDMHERIKASGVAPCHFARNLGIFAAGRYEAAVVGQCWDRNDPLSHRGGGFELSQSEAAMEDGDDEEVVRLGQNNLALNEGLETGGWRSVRKRPAPGHSFGGGIGAEAANYVCVEEGLEMAGTEWKKGKPQVRVVEVVDYVPAEEGLETAGMPWKTKGKPQNRVDEQGKEENLEKKQAEKIGKVTLSMQQLQVLKAIAQGKSVFVTGSAGTGKSFLVEFAIRVLNRIHGADSVFVTASTGLAACAIGGTTLHSFAGVGLGVGSKESLATKVLSRRESKKRWMKAQALVIDEISMIDGEFLDKLDYVGRTVRASSGKQKPFGGLQLVVTGDFFQLPPVKPENEKKYFAFEADCWSRCFDLQIELTHVFRQSDQDFVALLNEIRKGVCSPPTLSKLHGCTGPVGDQGIIPTRLYPHKVDVGRENDHNLRSLGRELVTFTAKDEGKSDFAIRLLENVRAVKLLSLCIGAQVMLVKNLDTEIGLVNGARGIVVRFSQEEDPLAPEAKDTMRFVSPSGVWPVVRFACDGLERVVRPESWSVLEGNTEIAKRTQVPLILAWALSVHKCQGMTLDRVETDLSKAFDYGMVYVALSRIRSLDGLQLIGFDPSRIKVHSKVVSFYDKLGKQK